MFTCEHTNPGNCRNIAVIRNIRQRTAPMHVLGKIIVYSEMTKSGLIQTVSGKPLYFSLSEWRSEHAEPRPGLAVKFINGLYAARSVEIAATTETSG